MTSPIDPLNTSAEDADSLDVLDQMAQSYQPSAGPAVDPRGGIFMPTAVEESISVPEATPRDMVCMRGPCRHYFQTVQFFPAGIVRGTLDHDPLQMQRACLRISPPSSLGDEAVYKCSEWDPIDPTEASARQTRRDAFYAANPEIKKLDEEREQLVDRLIKERMALRDDA